MSAPVLVDFAFALNIPTTTFVLNSASQGLLDTNLLASPDTMSDFSTRRVISFSVERTSSITYGPVIAYNAGTASITLLDDDGALDPKTLEAGGFVAPGTLMRIRYVFNDMAYPIFYGYVDTWIPNQISPTMATVTITATDGFSLLNTALGTLGSPVGANELSGARVSRLLDAAGWAASLRSIAAGDSQLQATSFGGAALDLIQEVAKNELGEFYQQPDGVMYFRNRHGLFADTRSTVSQATYGTNFAGGELPYSGSIEGAWDKTQLHNSAIVGIEGGTVQTRTDGTSAGRFGTRTFEETGLILTTDSDALNWGGEVISRDKDPVFRFTSVTLDSGFDPDHPVTIQQVTRRLGDRVTVIRRPPGVATDSRDVYIRGISHAYGNHRLKTSFALQPVTSFPGFTLDSATQGVLNTSVLTY